MAELMIAFGDDLHDALREAVAWPVRWRVIPRPASSSCCVTPMSRRSAATRAWSASGSATST